MASSGKAMTRSVLTSALSAVVVLLIITDVHAGSVVGDVKFTDTPPKLPLIKVTKDQDYCGETLPNETYLIDTNSIVSPEFLLQFNRW